jgi:hypothetical protein
MHRQALLQVIAEITDHFPLGTTLHLKNKYAHGYKLSVNFPEHSESRVEATIMKLFPHAIETMNFKTHKEYNVQVKGDSTQFSSNIDDSDLPTVAQVFELMELNSEKAGVTDWSFSQIGLEDVFYNIVRDSHSSEQNETYSSLGFTVN